MAHAVGVVLAMVRVAAGVLAVLSGDWIIGLWGVGELVAGWLACLNASRVVVSGRIDERRLGLLVPILYLGSSVFSVEVGEGPQTLLVGFLILILLAKIAARVALGQSHSAGPSTWLALVERGPYRWVRHPQMLLGILSRVVIWVGHPNAVNAVALGAATVCGVLVIVWEESFLATEPAYVAYSRRVPWRLVPGVWLLLASVAMGAKPEGSSDTYTVTAPGGEPREIVWNDAFNDWANGPGGWVSSEWGGVGGVAIFKHYESWVLAYDDGSVHAASVGDGTSNPFAMAYEDILLAGWTVEGGPDDPVTEDDLTEVITLLREGVTYVHGVCVGVWFLFGAVMYRIMHDSVLRWAVG